MSFLLLFGQRRRTDVVLPDAPTNIVMTGFGTPYWDTDAWFQSVSVGFDYATDPDGGFKLYASDSPSGPWTVVGTQPDGGSRTVNDDAIAEADYSQTRYYCVTAVVGGVESAKSDPVQVLAAPTLGTWTAISEAEINFITDGGVSGASWTKSYSVDDPVSWNSSAASGSGTSISDTINGLDEARLIYGTVQYTSGSNSSFWATPAAAVTRVLSVTSYQVYDGVSGPWEVALSWGPSFTGTSTCTIQSYGTSWTDGELNEVILAPSTSASLYPDSQVSQPIRVFFSHEHVDGTMIHGLPLYKPGAPAACTANGSGYDSIEVGCTNSGTAVPGDGSTISINADVSGNPGSFVTTISSGTVDWNGIADSTVDHTLYFVASDSVARSSIETRIVVLASPANPVGVSDDTDTEFTCDGVTAAASYQVRYEADDSLIDGSVDATLPFTLSGDYQSESCTINAVGADGSTGLRSVGFSVALGTLTQTAFEADDGGWVAANISSVDSTLNHRVRGTISVPLNGVEDMEAELIDNSLGAPGQFFGISLWNSNLTDWEVAITEDFLEASKTYTLKIYRITPYLEIELTLTTTS